MVLVAMWIWCSVGRAEEVKINSAQELEQFAALVNSGQNTLDAVIVAPIDLEGVEHTPIGTPDCPYEGSFDGGFQPINQLNAMLFGTIDGATLTRIYISSGEIRQDGNYSAHVGTLAGAAGTKAPNTITYCYSRANIREATCDAGGFVGKMYGSIKYCGFAGQLDNRSTTGGFIGSDIDGGHNTLIDHCFVITDLLQSNAYTGNMCGWQESGTIRNCYICSPQEAMFGHEFGTNEGNLKYTLEDFQSGAVCHLLNGTQDEIVFYQTLGEDNGPIPDATHKQVYVKGDVRCDGQTLSGYPIYTNEVNPKPDHTIVNGVCTVCGLQAGDFAELSEDGYYLLGTPEQLEWFAARVNGGENTLKGRLTAPLNYDGITHTPIGCQASYFMGAFDGQHFPILNLESMLFGSVSGSLIENVTLQGGAMGMDSKAASHTGTIVGNGGVGNPNTMRNCASSAVLVGVGTDAGGLAGKFIGTIENCYYTGSLLECTNTAGGIVGSSHGANLRIENCFVLSETLTGFADYLGTFAGWFDSGASISGCYAIENPDLTRFTGNAGNDFGAEYISAERFASGEIAYLLNKMETDSPVWYQTLGADTHPVLDPTHGKIYVNGQLSCNGQPIEGTSYTLSNTPPSNRPDHDYQNGVCQNCGAVEQGFVNITEDGWYELASAGNLEWFAGYVNKGNTNVKARVTAPLDLAGLAHRPIGNPSHPFTGTFDGGFYPISNINAMLFGTLGGATIMNVNLTSGAIEPNTEYAAHLGSIAGSCTTDGPNTITQCYSNVDVNNCTADAGGLVGKMYGSITYCGYTGRMNNQNTTGGLIGSDHSDSYSININHCFVLSECIAGANYVGALCGWMHTGEFADIYVSTPAEQLVQFQGGSVVRVQECTADEFASGEVCYAMNGGTFMNATWYQTIGVDEIPCLDATHGLVYADGDGTWDSQHDQATMEKMTATLADQSAAIADCIAQSELKETLKEMLSTLRGATTREALQETYLHIQAQQALIEASTASYEAYSQRVKAALDYLEEHRDELVDSEALDLMYDYCQSYQEPGEAFPNGSFMYIMDMQQLNDEQLSAETTFVEAKLMAVIEFDPYLPREVTRMLANADLSKGFDGWEGKVGSGTGTNGTMYAGEAWAMDMDMHQTLTGLQNGVYELVANGAFRPYQMVTSTQQAAMLYANDNQVYLQNVVECALPADEAEDGVNCYITEGAQTTDLPILDEEGNVQAWGLHGIQSCCYAFQAGRAVNRILVKVTDGTLTVGIKTMGTGQPNDWTGFGNFHLFYRGQDLETAGENIDQVLTAQLERAHTLLEAYQSDFTSDYPLYPNYSAELQNQVRQCMEEAEKTQAAAEKYALIERLSDLFGQVYDCKMAYIHLMQGLDALNSFVWDENEKGHLDQELLDETEIAFDAIWQKYIDGAYTAQQAWGQDDVRALHCYQVLFGDEPEQIDGVYQIASAGNLQWFAQMVNTGRTDLRAVQTAPIDEEGKIVFPIGNTTYGFNGSYDGQFYPIYNQREMLCGTLNGATITRVVIEDGQISSNSDYAAHCGSIAGTCETGAPNTITYCLSGTDITNSAGDAGGLVGKMWGKIEHCGYHGNISSQNTVGGIIGSDHSGGYSIDVSNCFVLSDVLSGSQYTGSLVGWQHAGSFQKCYVCTPAEYVAAYTAGSNTNIMEMTQEQFRSGEVCYLLNGQRSADPIWYQTLNADMYPVLDSTHAIVVLTANGLSNPTSVEEVLGGAAPAKVRVYDVQGRLIRQGVTPANSLLGLPKGMYVVEGKKFVVR